MLTKFAPHTHNLLTFIAVLVFSTLLMILWHTISVRYHAQKSDVSAQYDHGGVYYR